jgi:intraflagellar transport protein 88
MLFLSGLVNKGNVLYTKGDYEKAREFYKEALQNDSSCVEAQYNLGNHLYLLEYLIF